MEKTRFVLALLFVCFFLLTSSFVVAYGAVAGVPFWDSYQPYFTAMIGPVGIIMGYYFNNISSSITKTLTG